MKKAALFVALVLALIAGTAHANCASPPQGNFCVSASGYSQSEWGQTIINYTITSNLSLAQYSLVHLYINIDRAGCSGSNIPYEFHVDETGKLYALSTCNHITSPRSFQHNITYNKNGLSGSFIIPTGYLGDDGDCEVLVQAIDVDDDVSDSDVISVEITGGEDLHGGGDH